jgi:hypothetical protein
LLSKLLNRFNIEYDSILKDTTSIADDVKNYTVINASERFVNLRREFATDIAKFVDDLKESGDKSVSWIDDEFSDDVANDDKSRKDTGMKHQISETLHFSYTFLSLFLFRVPELGIPFAPEANHRKVVKGNFYVINEHTKHSLESSMKEGINDGLDARKLVVYPFSVTDKVDDRTPLCSVSMTNLDFGDSLNFKTNTTVLKAGNLACERSTSIDFIFLQIFFGMNNLYDHSSNVRAWSELAKRSNKFATKNDFESFFDASSITSANQRLLNCFTDQGECKFVYIYTHTHIRFCGQS